MLLQAARARPDADADQGRAGAGKGTVAVTGQKGHPGIKRLGNSNGARGLHNRDNTARVAAIKANADRRGLARSDPQMHFAEGITSPGGIANALNERGIVTARSGQWSASTVINALSRIQTLEAAAA